MSAAVESTDYTDLIAKRTINIVYANTGNASPNQADGNYKKNSPTIRRPKKVFIVLRPPKLPFSNRS
jgi:hypothetical protein